MNIQEIRAKYPQYGQMTDQQLGKALHDKYYSSMPYDQFASKIGLTADRSVPDSAPAAEPKKDAGTFAQRADRAITGAGEAALSLLTSATGGALGFAGGAVGGIAGDIATGKYGTKEGAELAGDVASEAAGKLTYEPRTEEGKQALATIGSLFEKSKLEGLGPAAVTAGPAIAETAAAARAPTRQAVGHAARVVRQGAREASEAVAEDWRGQPASVMPGMGAANTAPETIRRERAAALPVPIDLTKGQASRDFAQQQFEREAAKNAKVGEPLRQRFSEQNEKILKNFDAWIDQTGAEAGSLRATGQAVTDAVVAKSHRAKAEINSAYKAARDAGDMQERIDAAPLRQYIADHQAEAINAPVLTSVEKKLEHVLGKDGTASLNDLEEVRKMVGKLSGKDATNAVFGKEVKGVLDGMTEGRGGELYKKARALRHRYAQEFEDHGVVDKLLSFKPGTRDRAVAYEDVFAHSILKGSLDDVRIMRKTLQTAGPQGEQAWRELQGGTLKHIRDEITKTVQVDQSGRTVASPARLNALVTELDKDGKLDFVFGKHGAQQIRDLNEIAKDVFTSPPGSVNQSNTASILIAMLDKLAAKTTGVPFVGAATGFASKEWRAAGERSKVREALKP